MTVQDIRNKIQDLRKEGKFLHQIAEELGWDKVDVCSFILTYDLSFRPVLSEDDKQNGVSIEYIKDVKPFDLYQTRGGFFYLCIEPHKAVRLGKFPFYSGKGCDEVTYKFMWYDDDPETAFEIVTIMGKLEIFPNAQVTNK